MARQTTRAASPQPARKSRRGGEDPSQTESGNGKIRELDECDEAILACLRADGRISNRDLASEVGLNEATVRARLRRLEENDIMRVVAMVDLEAAGFKFVAPVGVQIKGRSVEEVGADLAAIPQIVTISAVVGVQDIELQIVARDMDELNLILTKRIPSIGGIARITPALAMNVLKYESPWVPFT